jgi:hypothetical protein
LNFGGQNQAVAACEIVRHFTLLMSLKVVVAGFTKLEYLWELLILLGGFYFHNKTSGSVGEMLNCSVSPSQLSLLPLSSDWC